MTRIEAIANGMRLYNTGVPCIRGHNSPRYTVTGACKECSKENSAKYRAKRDGQIVERIYMVHPDDLEKFDAIVALINGVRKITPCP